MRISEVLLLGGKRGVVRVVRVRVAGVVQVTHLRHMLKHWSSCRSLVFPVSPSIEKMPPCLVGNSSGPSTTPFISRAVMASALPLTVALVLRRGRNRGRLKGLCVCLGSC